MVSPTAAKFLECGRVVRDSLDNAEIAIRWDEPSVLEQMSIGELAAHLAGAVFTVERYLDKTDAEVTRNIETIVDYFVAALYDTDYRDGLDSDLQRAVRGRAADLASKGAVVLVEELGETLERLGGSLDDGPDRLTVLGGLSIPTDAYLEGRIVEMVVHQDDLDRSVTVDLPPLPGDATELVADRLFDMAKRILGPQAMVRAFTRRELGVDTAVF